MRTQIRVDTGLRSTSISTGPIGILAGRQDLSIPDNRILPDAEHNTRTKDSSEATLEMLRISCKHQLCCDIGTFEIPQYRRVCIQ